MQKPDSEHLTATIYYGTTEVGKAHQRKVEMAGKGPGQYYRTGITLEQLFDKFPDDAAAEQWFAKIRWPHGIKCPHCAAARAQDASTTRLACHTIALIAAGTFRSRPAAFCNRAV